MRYFKIALILTILLGFIYTFLNIIEPSLYNYETKGKIIKNEEVYEKCNAILSKKYEKIIYEDKNSILYLYAKQAQKDLKKTYSTMQIDNIREKFNDFTIEKIEKKAGVYIIYYYITDINHQEFFKNKLVVKIKNNNGCIYYDKWYGVI